jgi:hypothetical protein
MKNLGYIFSIKIFTPNPGRSLQTGLGFFCLKQILVSSQSELTLEKRKDKLERNLKILLEEVREVGNSTKTHAMTSILSTWSSDTFSLSS